MQSRGLRGEIKVLLLPQRGEKKKRGGGVITVKLKGTTIKACRDRTPRNSSKWSHGASFAYQIVKYCPWHQRNRGVINALNQFRITLYREALPGCRHYRKLCGRCMWLKGMDEAGTVRFQLCYEQSNENGVSVVRVILLHNFVTEWSKTRGNKLKLACMCCRQTQLLQVSEHLYAIGGKAFTDSHKNWL